jgi:hypothetical protein
MMQNAGVRLVLICRILQQLNLGRIFMKLVAQIIGFVMLGLSNIVSADAWTPLNLSNTTFFYTPSATAIWQYDGNLTPQNPTAIGGFIEIQFGLTSGSLTNVSFINADGSNASNSSIETILSYQQLSNIVSFQSEFAFNYLAVHFGGYELFFRFENAIKEFLVEADLNGICGQQSCAGGGVSNLRAYTDARPSAVPLPAAAWLFMSSLGLFAVSRKRSQG